MQLKMVNDLTITDVENMRDAGDLGDEANSLIDAMRKIAEGMNLGEEELRTKTLGDLAGI